jgi:cyclase
VSYAGDYVLQMGGVQMKLIHFGNAYTDEDTVVYFPDLKVVAIGDLFTFGLPEPDYLAGGSLVAWGPVIARILELDFDVVVPGKGRVVTRRELEAFEARINTMVARARELVKNGVSRDLLATQLETDDLGWHWNLTGSELDGFYAELARMQ